MPSTQKRRRFFVDFGYLILLNSKIIEKPSTLPDRHTNNFGLLRDVESGKLFGLAPNYDNNMALISKGYPSKPKSSDMLIKLFNELMETFPEYKKYIPNLSSQTVKDVISELHMMVKSNLVTEIVMSRYDLINK